MVRTAARSRRIGRRVAGRASAKRPEPVCERSGTHLLVTVIVESFEAKLGGVIARWVRLAASRPVVTLLVAAAFTVAALGVAALRLGVVSDTDELFDADLPFSQLRMEVEQALPLRADTVLVVVDGPTELAAGDAAIELAARLEAEGDPFEAAYAPGLDAFFQTHGFLYLESEALDDLADDLARAQPFLAELRRDPSVRGVFTQLEVAVRNIGTAPAGGLDLDRVFGGIAQPIEITVRQERVGPRVGGIDP